MQGIAIGAAGCLPNILIVRSAANLRALRKVRNRRRLLLVLRVPGLPRDISRKWETKLNSSMRECGCSLGAKCVIVAFLSSVLWQSLYSSWSVSYWPVFLLRTLLIVLVAGAVGKIVGQTRAAAEIRAIEEKIQDSERRYSAGG